MMMGQPAMGGPGQQLAGQQQMAAQQQLAGQQQMMGAPQLMAGQQMMPQQQMMGGQQMMPQQQQAMGPPMMGQQAIGYGFRPPADKFRHPCKACGVPGHWVRDGLCRPEDVAAKMAREYAAYQQTAGAQQQQALEPPAAALEPPGKNRQF
jgi:hypothetical protein